MAAPATARIVLPRLFSSPEKKNFVLGLLLLLTTVALYNRAGRDPFVNYDDERYVVDNYHVRAGLRLETVKWAFTSFEESNWHPLSWLSHAMDCQLFGLDPEGPHYTSILLHALNVGLLFWLLWRATGDTGRSWTAAALFAVHPINVESVAWIAERKNILSLLFFLLAFLSYQWYARKPGVGRYLLVTAFYACGLMAKPMIITFPFLVLLWDYWPLKRWQDATTGKYRIRSLALEKVPLLLLSIVSSAVTIAAQRAGHALGTLTKYPVHVRWENVSVAYLGYLLKAVCPFHLAPMYPFDPSSLTPGRVFLSATAVAGITTFVLIERQRRPYLLVGWFWFLGSLVPMIGIVQVGRQAMADRYAYLPFIGLFVMVCWAIADGAVRLHLPRRWITAVAAICLLVLAVVTHRQIGYWGDNVILWSHALQVTEDNAMAEDNLGGALLAQDKIDDALPHFRMAAKLDPTDPLSRLNLAADEQAHGHLAQSIEHYTEILQIADDLRIRAMVLGNLGYALRELGDSAQARESFRASLKLRPRNARVWLGLGLVCEKTGDYAGALNAYSNLTAIQPDIGYYMLAQVLQITGRSDESKAAMAQARRISSNFNQLQQFVNSMEASGGSGD